MKNLLLIALSTAALSAHAWEPDVYIGANGAAWQYGHSVASVDLKVNSLEGVAGLRLTEYIAIEARLGVGVNTGRGTKTTVRRSGEEDDPATTLTDESISDIENTSYEVKAAGYGSFYFKPMISNEKASLYGLLGYTNVQIEQTGTGDAPIINYDDTVGDLSYGVGVSFVMSEHTQLTAEWRKLINAKDLDMRGGSLGFLYMF